MMNKITIDDSDEVYSSDLIIDTEADVPTVRYNSLAYKLKLMKQTFDEAPITQRLNPT